MKTYITDIIPRIERFSQKLDDVTKLTNQHWVCIDDIEQTKRVYIFRTYNQLLISDNGVVEKARWEYLGNQSLLIDTSQGSYLLRHSFFDQNIIALKLDSTDNYAFFVNETLYNKELNTIDDILNFLSKKYLTDKGKNTDITSSGYIFSQPNSWKEKVFISDEQKEWMDNPDRCPGCGFSGVMNKNECPDCGLQLI